MITRRTTIEEKTLKQNWGTIWKLTENRQEWRTFVAALDSSTSGMRAVSKEESNNVGKTLFNVYSGQCTKLQLTS